MEKISLNTKILITCEKSCPGIKNIFITNNKFRIFIKSNKLTIVKPRIVKYQNGSLSDKYDDTCDDSSFIALLFFYSEEDKNKFCGNLYISNQSFDPNKIKTHTIIIFKKSSVNVVNKIMEGNRNVIKMNLIKNGEKYRMSLKDMSSEKYENIIIH